MPRGQGVPSEKRGLAAASPQTRKRVAQAGGRASRGGGRGSGGNRGQE